MGQIQLGTEDADIPGAGLVELGKVSLKSKALAKVTGHEAILLINVYTSRKKFADNLFDCGIFEDKVSLAAKTPIAIACKLIGE